MKQIMKPMKRLLLLLPACCGTLLCADLADVHSVYVLPMAHGMEQYLANRLTNDHVFRIVTDPKLADAVLTDRIGTGLQARLDEMLPAPVAEKPAPKEGEKEKDAPDKDSSTSLADSMGKLQNPANNSSVGRSRGTVFLVDTKSRQVVWSAYDLPKDSSSKELDRTASDIVSRIKKDLSPKK
jgi:hypothetical protein